MRKGLSSQPVEAPHPNRRTELELLFVSPEHDSDDDDFETKYPYPDESPYLELYEYPVPYLGQYPDYYGDYGENGPYSGADVEDPHSYPNPYPNPYPEIPEAYNSLRDSAPIPESSDTPNVSAESASSNSHKRRKAVKFPWGTNDIHPPSVDRVQTPHHVSAWKSDRHPIRTAESSIGEVAETPRYTFEEQQKFLYEGLCEQLLRERAREMTGRRSVGCEIYASALGSGELTKNEMHQRQSQSQPQSQSNLQIKNVPQSKFSSDSEESDITRSADSLDSPGAHATLSNQFASVQDSIRVAVNRGIEGRYGMVYGEQTGESAHPHDHRTSPTCVLSQIRSRVSSTATLFKRVVSRPFRHKGPKAEDENHREWKTVSLHSKRGVSRLFKRSSSSKWVPLNDSPLDSPHLNDESVRCGEYGWWNKKLNGAGGVATFL